MTFDILLQSLIDYGPIVLFVVVLVEQLGLPAPGSPLLVLTGALCSSGRMTFFFSILASVFACLIADACWYWVAKQYLVKRPDRFRLSSSKLGTYLQTRRLHFLCYGYWLFLMFKFLPGPNMVSLHLGYFGSGRPRHLLLDVIASLLWTGGYLGLGYAFGSELHHALAILPHVGMVPLGIILAVMFGMKISGVLRRNTAEKHSC